LGVLSRPVRGVQARVPETQVAPCVPRQPLPFNREQ